MKPSRRQENLQARLSAHVQTNSDEGPAKRWRSGGYKAPGSLSGRNPNGAKSAHGLMPPDQRSRIAVANRKVAA